MFDLVWAEPSHVNQFKITHHVLLTVLTEGRVEVWMNDVLVEMRQTNRFITKKAIFAYGKERQRPRYINHDL